MANLYPVAPTGPRQRPNVVTYAGYLMFGIGGILLLQIIISLVTMNKILDAASNVQDANGTNLRSAESVGLYLGLGLDVLLAIFFVILGVFVLRGSNGMRITTFVFAGLAILCSFCGLIGTGLSGSLTSSTANSANSAQLKAIRDAQPGWAKGGSIGLSLLTLLAAVFVIVLLTRKASNDFFRKPELVAPGYPGYPSYPSYPTYPSVPADPPVPPTGDQGWTNPGGNPPGTP